MAFGRALPLRLICQALIICALIAIIRQSAYILHAQSPKLNWEKIIHSNGPKTLRPGWSSKWDGSQSPPDCQAFPAAAFADDGIQVTLKIGQAESQDLLNSHFNGVTTCIPNLLVVSDMGQKFGPFHSHDVLADAIHVLSDEDRRTYQRQREYTYYWDEDMPPSREGWLLDRYKFLTMVEYAYAQNPNAKWYVFLEADSFILWENLVQLLARFKWVNSVYIGSPSPGRPLESLEPQPTWFAYGGAGFVLSVAAMENLLRENRQGKAGGGSDQESQLLVTKYQDAVRSDCCGDSILGWVAAQRNVKIQGQWPMFNPQALRSTPLGRAYWCQPAISFHKSDPFDTVELWRWQQKRRQETDNDLQRPVLYSDLVDFFDFVSVPIRDDWDNAEIDAFDAPTQEAHNSFESCKEACHNHADCLQFTHRRKNCRMVPIIRLGNPAPPGDRHPVAGWDIEKIQAFKNAHECKEVDWPMPSIERIF